MTKIETLAYQLNRQILETKEIQEYKKYENMIHSNEDLVLLEQQIKDLQKTIVHLKASKEDANEAIQLYQQLKNKFENHPIVVNYLYHKEEADLLLQTINQQINGQLK